MAWIWSFVPQGISCWRFGSQCGNVGRWDLWEVGTSGRSTGAVPPGEIVGHHTLWLPIWSCDLPCLRCSCPSCMKFLSHQNQGNASALPFNLLNCELNKPRKDKVVLLSVFHYSCEKIDWHKGCLREIYISRGLRTLYTGKVQRHPSNKEPSVLETGNESKLGTEKMKTVKEPRRAKHLL